MNNTYFPELYFPDGYNLLGYYPATVEGPPSPVDRHGAIPNPYTLSGTAIQQISSNMEAWAAAAHRHASEQRNYIEIWYLRDGTWHAFPEQPAASAKYGIRLSRVYRQPATVDAVVPDGLGLLTRDNRNSAINYNGAGAFDPVMDVARKIVVRGGCWCFNNLATGIVPTASAAPSLGTLAGLTDGLFWDWSGRLTFSNAAAWSLSGVAPALDITFDLGGSKVIEHVGVRFGTRLSGFTLPASVTVETSLDGATWASWPARPVGGPSGDWDESEGGQAVEINISDMRQPARFVRLHVVGVDGPSSLGIDEVAIWGGGAGAYRGANVFTGHLGEGMNFNARGMVQFTAIDATKRAADNNEAVLTAQFGSTGTTNPGPDVADIAYTLLTQTAYWHGDLALNPDAYDAPFTSDEVGWTFGSKITGFPMPVWQGQNNSIYGYVLELFNMIGWVVGVDGNGIWQAYEPTYKQVLPDRLMIAAPDGCNDAWAIERSIEDKDMRNVVEVSTGKTRQAGSGSIVEIEPQSVSSYGRRRMRVADPIASSADIRRKMAQYVLRDYAFRLKSAPATIRPDFEMRLRDVHAIRAIGRVQMYARDSSVSGDLRGQELWSLMQLSETITAAEWKAEAQYVPYVPADLDPPVVVSLISEVASTDITLTWEPYASSPRLASFDVYFSSVSEYGPWIKRVTGVGNTALTLPGQTPGQQMWAYVTAVDTRGHESIPSDILTTVIGTGSHASGTLAGWIVTDLAASFNQVSGPDAQGYYTYEFFITWTSPPSGFKRMALFFATPHIPTNPNDGGQWLYQDEWHGDYIGPGLTWDRATFGLLTWYGRFRVAAPLASGQKVYWRMATSTATTRWRDPQWSNIAVSAVA